MSTYRFALALLTLLAGCSDSSPRTAKALAGYDHNATSAHFSYYWKSGNLDASEIGSVIAQSERGFMQVADFLGPEHTPKQPLVMLLEGASMLQPSVRPSFPNVDDTATIRLYRFPGDLAPYEQGMPHELVHAFRKDMIVLHEDMLKDDPTGYEFVEEAMAEFVAQQVAPGVHSFPSYGAALEVVTGFWLTTNRDVPLAYFLVHPEANPRCLAQAYPERASFFRYLFGTYGKAKLFQLAYQQAPLTKDSFAATFGVSFDDLAAAWRPWALAQFKAVPDGPAQVDKYLNDTAIGFFPACDANGKMNGTVSGKSLPQPPAAH
jgi:hypothetical protein